jgi:hypothetical protein
VVKAPFQVVYYAVKGTYELNRRTIQARLSGGKVHLPRGEGALGLGPHERRDRVLDGLSPKEAIRQGRVKMAPYR